MHPRSVGRRARPAEWSRIVKVTVPPAIYAAGQVASSGRLPADVAGIIAVIVITALAYGVIAHLGR